MNYIPPFAVLLRDLEITGDADARRVSLSYADFLAILQRILADVDFDEAWYLRANPDVERGIRSGILQSARQHFVDHGYFEGRLPALISVDAAWYVERYPDVADDMRHGRIISAQEHFDQVGYNEGRIPFNLEA